MPMLVRLSVFFFFLYVIELCIAGAGRETVVVFKGGETEIPFEENDKTITKRKPDAFRVPAFVGGVVNGKEFFAVFSKAQYDKYSESRFVQAVERTSCGNYKKWSDAVFFAQKTQNSLKLSVLGEVTAVMKENKIFVLLPSWKESRSFFIHDVEKNGWEPLMIVGTISNFSDCAVSGAAIKWENGNSLKNALPTTVNRAKGTQFIGGVGNGIVTKSGTIVFPVQIANNKSQMAAAVLSSTDNGANWKIGGTTEIGPTECSVAEWNNEKLILSTRNNYGYRTVYESDNMGETWKESLMFSRVWGNQRDRKGAGNQQSVITVQVDGKDVLLFSHPLNKKGGYARDTLQLWMSDGKRIMCVGTISEKGKGENSGYSILAHVGSNLYSVHEINPFVMRKNHDAKFSEWDRVIGLTPLPDFLEKVKNTIRQWHQLDENYQSIGISTDALVGFLGSTKKDNENVWADVYNCVDATVNGGKSENGGFRFDGKSGSGAQWPVISQGQNQVYMFTKKQFTLAATVIIHKSSAAEDVSVLGASKDAKGSALLFGIGYTKDNKWCALKSFDEKEETKISFALEEEYNTAITFSNGAVSLYVDAVNVLGSELKVSAVAQINHFFFGGAKLNAPKEIGNFCTVKNAMLFSRALRQNEIAELTKVSKENKLNEIKETEELTIAPDKSKKVSTTHLTIAQEKGKTVLTAEPKETAANVWQKNINEKPNETKVNNHQHEPRDVFSKKSAKSDSGAMASLSAAVFMFFILFALCLF